MITTEQFRNLWPSVTAGAMSLILIGKSLGFMKDLPEGQVEILLGTAGTVLLGLTLRSGVAASANASIVNSANALAGEVLKNAGTQAAALETQAVSLQAASQAVVAAAVAAPTNALISAASEAAASAVAAINETKQAA